MKYNRNIKHNETIKYLGERVGDAVSYTHLDVYKRQVSVYARVCVVLHRAILNKLVRPLFWLLLLVIHITICPMITDMCLHSKLLCDTLD